MTAACSAVKVLLADRNRAPNAVLQDYRAFFSKIQRQFSELQALDKWQSVSAESSTTTSQAWPLDVSTASVLSVGPDSSVDVGGVLERYSDMLVRAVETKLKNRGT